VLDGLLLAPASVEPCRDLLEVVGDRCGARSAIVASQLPVDKWHAAMSDPTLAGAVMGRVCQAAHRVALEGPSVRKRQPGRCQRSVTMPNASRGRAPGTPEAFPGKRTTRNAPEEPRRAQAW
jgi:hypothetical protein